jgi:hypothetical protein
VAFPVILKTYVDKIANILAQFDKYHPSIVYTADTSADSLRAAMITYDTAIEVRNADAIKFSNSITALDNAAAELSKQESAFLLQTGARFTKDSNEYVWAGGTRQSEVNAKRQATIEENQRLEKIRLEEEAAKAKAEKERVDAEMVALRAEIERLRAEKDATK